MIKRTVGFDVGHTNGGLVVCDDTHMQISVINFTLMTVNGRQVKIKLTPSNYIQVAKKFVVANDELFKTVTDVAIEIQLQKNMELFAQAMGGVIAGRYDHITLRHVSAKSTRAFFNTGVWDKTLTRAEKYALRKKLSVVTLPRLLPNMADRARFDDLFGVKEDDAVEATLLALWAHHFPAKNVAQKGTPCDAPKVRSMMVTKPRDIHALRITDAERNPLVTSAKSSPASKKRTAKTVKTPRKRSKAAPPSP